jgi:hypothetical protein
MKNNNNNNRNLIPFSLESFNLSDFKSIILKYSHHSTKTSGNLLKANMLHIFDSNKFHICILPFNLTYSEEDDHYDYCVNLLYKEIWGASAAWSEEISEEFLEPDLFYIQIIVR